jgi:hypothetical protein
MSNNKTNITQRTVIKETDRYRVEAIFADEGDFEFGTYAIINRETGVQEMESPILPQILMYLNQIEGHLTQVEEGDDEESLADEVIRLN